MSLQPDRGFHAVSYRKTADETPLHQLVSCSRKQLETGETPKCFLEKTVKQVIKKVAFFCSKMTRPVSSPLKQVKWPKTSVRSLRGEVPGQGERERS